MPELERDGPTVQDILLQRFVDGELEPDEQRAFEARLVQEPELVDQLAGTRRVSELVVSASHYAVEQLDSEKLFARISADVESTVISATSTQDMGEKRATDVGKSVLARLVGRGIWMPAGGAFAMVGALLLTVYQPLENSAFEGSGSEVVGHEPEMSSNVRPIEGTASAERSDPVSAQLAIIPSDKRPAVGAATGGASAVAGAEVVQVDFGDHAGTVFDIALENGATTAVVWIND